MIEIKSSKDYGDEGSYTKKMSSRNREYSDYDCYHEKKPKRKYSSKARNHSGDGPYCEMKRKNNSLGMAGTIENLVEARGETILQRAEPILSLKIVKMHHTKDHKDPESSQDAQDMKCVCIVCSIH